MYIVGVGRMEKNRFKENKLLVIETAIVTCVVVGFIGLLISKGYDQSEFISKFEFTATITSIILSVIAIIYTITESKYGENAIIKINSAMDLLDTNMKGYEEEISKIRKVTDSIEEYGDVVEKLEMIHIDLKKEMNEMNKKNLEFRNSVEAFAEVAMSNANHEIEGEEVEYSYEQVKDIFNRMSMLDKGDVLFAYNVYQSRNMVNMFDYSKHYNDFVKREMLGEGIGITSVLRSCSNLATFGFIAFNILEKENLVIYEFNKHLEKIVKETDFEFYLESDPSDYYVFYPIISYFKKINS